MLLCAVTTKVAVVVTTQHYLLCRLLEYPRFALAYSKSQGGAYIGSSVSLDTLVDTHERQWQSQTS